MNREKIVKIKSTELLDRYNLPRLTLDNLIYIIEDLGFEIIEFSSPDDPLNTLIKELKVEKYAKSRDAFAYQLGSAKYVFVFENLSADEKLFAMAHELGHIYCSHLKEGNIEYSVEEEYEANEFTHYILHPSLFSKAKRWLIERKKGVITVAVVVAVIFVTFLIVSLILNNNSYYGEYYITQSGEKYHREDCIFIKDKKNVERLTEKKYRTGEYDPCQICLPNE